MTKVTICSEPLIEKFGRGFSPADQAITSCSGDALNVAGALTRMLDRLGEYNGDNKPHEVSVLCGVGDDERGKKIKDFMGRDGENIASAERVVTLKGRKTSAYTIHLEEGGTRRSAEYIDRGPDSAMCQLFEPHPYNGDKRKAIHDVSNNTDVLVITGIGASRARGEEAFNRLVNMAKTVKKRGGAVVVDLNHRFDGQTGNAKLWIDDNGEPLSNELIRERMDRLFALADLAFVAHDEIWPLYGEFYEPPLKTNATSAEPVIEHLRALPKAFDAPRHIVFKRGKEGATLFKDPCVNRLGTGIDIPADAVEVVERTGGGDGLTGGTIAALLRGYTLDKAVAVGQLTAGKVLGHKGGVLLKKALPNDVELGSIIPLPPQAEWPPSDPAREHISVSTGPAMPR